MRSAALLDVSEVFQSLFRTGIEFALEWRDIARLHQNLCCKFTELLWAFRRIEWHAFSGILTITSC